ncbi:MAG: tripartite tricarboxylate transporter substrate-binding protein, partial [Rhodococcus sp.]|nr:tripartite tricarboxylate transporter substrate-binding protein [Rhodococcus sp. (in: high G+C Gram-positive bacteria)]
MSETSVSNHEDAPLPLTGERTVPGIPEENYWFRRHEVVYRALLERCTDRRVLEAGSGEGYGANMIADVATKVTGLDYDISAVEHVRARYPRVEMLHGNLAELPLADNSVDVVVNFQVIEHLWDQGQFLRECFRVLAPGGELLISGLNGTVSLGIGEIQELTAQLEAGEVRILTTYTTERLEDFADVPTASEQGIDLVIDKFPGIAGPAGPPA